jgi:anti-sigma factor RsiW
MNRKCDILALQAYVRGSLSSKEARRVERHADGCAACSAMIE